MIVDAAPLEELPTHNPAHSPHTALNTQVNRYSHNSRAPSPSRRQCSECRRAGQSSVGDVIKLESCAAASEVEFSLDVS